MRKYDMTPEDRHVSGHLSNVALNYDPAVNLVADMVLPIVDVAKKSDSVPIFDKGDWYRIENIKRAPGTEAKRVGLDVTSVGYTCENYAAMYPVTVEDVANNDLGFGASMEDGARFATTKVLLAKEQRLAALVTTGTAHVGGQTAVASFWSDSINSAPFSDLMTAIEAFNMTQGIKPNGILFGQIAWDLFRRSEEARAVLYPHGGGIVTRDAARNLFEVDKLLVAGGFYNSISEPLTTSLSPLIPDNVLLFYAPMAASRTTPSWGYTFRWTNNGLPREVIVHPYDSKRKCWEVEANEYTDEVLTAPSLGYLVCNVSSTTY